MTLKVHGLVWVKRFLCLEGPLIDGFRGSKGVLRGFDGGINDYYNILDAYHRFMPFGRSGIHPNRLLVAWRGSG